MFRKFLGALFGLLFLFPFLYLVYVLLAAVFATGGLFPAVIALIMIGILGACVYLNAKARTGRK